MQSISKTKAVKAGAPESRARGEEPVNPSTPGFTRQVEISPAFDRRHADPKKNYGIQGVTMRFILKGEKGAVTFTLFTNWHLPHVARETDRKILDKATAGLLDESWLRALYHPMAADLGYHSPELRYEGQEARECDLLDGRQCYHGSGGDTNWNSGCLQAEKIYETLLTEGGEGVWRELGYFYAREFEGKMKRPAAKARGARLVNNRKNDD